MAVVDANTVRNWAESDEPVELDASRLTDIADQLERHEASQALFDTLVEAAGLDPAVNSLQDLVDKVRAA